MIDKIFILATDDDIDHMLYSETRDEIKRCNAEILRLRELLAVQQSLHTDASYCRCPITKTEAVLKGSLCPSCYRPRW